MEDSLKIYFAKEKDFPKEVLTTILEFVNQVYEEGEKGMWMGTVNRTSAEELRDKLSANQLVVAEQNKEIKGVIQVYKTEDNLTAEFAMLAVNPQYMKQRIGGRLIDFAEQWAIQNGMKIMRLELLTPANWKQPSKEFLQKWYRRLGYISQGKKPFAIDYPHLAPFLITACDFTEWRKRLV